MLFSFFFKDQLHRVSRSCCALAFSCCPTSGPPLSDLNNADLLSHSPIDQEPHVGLGLKQGIVGLRSFPGKPFACSVGCWQNSVPRGLGLRSPFPCWLSAEGHSQLPEVTAFPGCGPPASICKASNRRSRALKLSFLVRCTSQAQPGKGLFSKDSCDRRGTLA